MTRTLNAPRGRGDPGARRRRSSRRRGAGDRVRHQRRSAEDAERRLRRRSRRRRRQFEGPDLRLHAHRPSVRDARRQPHVLARRLAAVPVRSRRASSCASSGQDVYGFNAAIGLRVDPQDNVWTIDVGAEPGREVRPRRPRRARARPQAGNDRRAAGAAAGAARGGGAGGGAPARRRRGSGAVRRAAAPRRRRRRSAAAAAAAAPGSGTPGSSFNRPTDVAWDKAGNIYVADGIGNNNRVAKFDKDGRFIKHWGSTGTGPGPVQRREGDRRSTRRATSTSPTPATSASRCSTREGTFKSRVRQRRHAARRCA